MVPSIVNNKEKIVGICKRNNIVFLGVFGSYARDSAAEDSDIDLLVRFSKPISLLEQVRIERLFSEALGRKADLLTEVSISPYLKSKIKRETKVFYERTG